jgi:hypothetical protein
MSLIETHLATNAEHPTVTLEQEQKEKLLYEVFDAYGDNPIPEE